MNKFIQIFLIVLLLSGCTKSLWEPDHYREELTGFYLVPDKNQLIVSGKKYSYIFNIDKQFSDVLKVSRDIEFLAEFYHFKLDEYNNISGELNFRVNQEELSTSELKTVTKLGFESFRSSDLFYSNKIFGKRYEVEGEFPFMVLDKEHFIHIDIPNSFKSTVGKIVATPVTITADVFVVIPATILAVIFVDL